MTSFRPTVPAGAAHPKGAVCSASSGFRFFVTPHDAATDAHRLAPSPVFLSPGEASGRSSALSGSVVGIPSPVLALSANDRVLAAREIFNRNTADEVAEVIANPATDVALREQLQLLVAKFPRKDSDGSVR